MDFDNTIKIIGSHKIKLPKTENKKIITLRLNVGVHHSAESQTGEP